MKLDILICTLNEGIAGVSQIFLAPRADVRYIISMQYTDDCYLKYIPEDINKRNDVKLLLLKGKGLSRNRNNALQAATSDLALIADDDVRYTDQYIDTIFKVFDKDNKVDIAQFKIKSDNENMNDRYPPCSCTYPNVRRGLYASSIELVLRVSTVRGKVWFDERFGLGSPYFNCGEESIFVHDAVQKGLTVTYFPYHIVEHINGGTGRGVFTDERVMMANGAVQYHIHGWSSYLRMTKFALIGALKRQCSFIRIIQGTFKGINYYRKVVRHESPIGG